jgi:hypothetical protein
MSPVTAQPAWQSDEGVGRHSVPEADVRRRFNRGIALFQQVYKPLVDEWYHWHSDDAGLRLGEHHE